MTIVSVIASPRIWGMHGGEAAGGDWVQGADAGESG